MIILFYGFLKRDIMIGFVFWWRESRIFFVCGVVVFMRSRFCMMFVMRWVLWFGRILCLDVVIIFVIRRFGRVLIRKLDIMW